MRIGVYGREFDAKFARPVKQLLDALHKEDFSLVIHSDFCSYLKDQFDCAFHASTLNTAEDVKDLDFLISIGGDGTILDTIAIVRDSNIPVLGINTGRLGFLSNVAVEDIQNTVKCLKERDFHLDSRSLIKVDGLEGITDFPYALNEVTIHKKDTSNMITVRAWVDDVFMNSYWADGLIVSTPTGSTAYNLSCGGPIVMPGSENVVLTPIAPHNLNVRPVVIPSSCQVRLEAQTRDQDILLTLDSRSFSIENGASVKLSRSSFKVDLISLPGQEFFGTIRSKMMWGIDKRN
ncbi:MAG: NAD kinase [Flavobacteriales bacterium]|nr:NAD kinase [Flavobacteriales bacterium]